MRIFLVFSASLALIGCVSMGTNYDPAAVSQLTVGMSKQQVVKLLGTPNQTVSYGDGTQRLVWVHSKGSMLGAKARAIGLPFDREGKLAEVPSGSVQ